MLFQRLSGLCRKTTRSIKERDDGYGTTKRTRMLETILEMVSWDCYLQDHMVGTSVMTEDEYYEAWFGGRKLFSFTFHHMDDDVWESLNLHGSPRFEGRKRKRYKKTIIPNGIELPVDEDDSKLTQYYDVEITDEITDTTIEEILNDL